MSSDSTPEKIRRMLEELSKQETEEGRMKGYRFQPSKEDIMIVSPAKCGTTWLCQIVQSLRSGGSMDFEEINLVIPCLEMAHDGGYLDLQAPQPWAPRCYKTHFNYDQTPKGAGKYLFICRDPLEAAPSFYHFLKGWVFEGEGADGISLAEFVHHFFTQRGEPRSPMQNASIWHEIASWWPHRHDPRVLFLTYEDLHEDLPAAVRLIACFTGLAAGDAEAQALAVRQSSIDFMRQHPTKFDEHMLKRGINLRSGRPADSGLEGPTTSGSKVRLGKLGANRQELGPAEVAAIQAKWTEVMQPVCGCATYDEMRRQLNQELGRPFCRQPAAAAALEHAPSCPGS